MSTLDEMNLHQFYESVKMACDTLKEGGFDLKKIKTEFKVDDRSEGTTVIATHLEKMNFNLMNKNSKIEIIIS